ncbi:fatty acid--CoA ligase [Hydrocarboniphaga sp.]|uniref:fatty acid--CoA ligase n=1 Tax=Hydrocarboniphaga sp. TaxID=2033016 RepID=UPI003D0ADDDC
MNENADAPAGQANAYPLLIKQLWLSPLAISANQQIVYKGTHRQTYRQTRQRIARLANVLQTIGVRAGDTVAVMDWDSHRYLECYFAIPMMGATLMTVNVRLSASQIAYTLNHSKAQVLLMHADFKPVVDELRAELEHVRHIIWLADDAGLPVPGLPVCVGEYENLLSQAQPDHVFPDFDENTRATTFYTTGTTGQPKGVYFSHRQLVLHTLSGMAALASPEVSQRFHRGDVYMPMTPMFHVHAWGMPYIATLLGVKQVYPGRYMPDELLRLIDTEAVTFSHCVPTILQMLLSSASATSVDLSRWKVVIGGAALSGGLVDAARDRGIDVFGGYGMSETCPLLSIAQLHPALGTLDRETEVVWRCKAGAAVPLVELRCVDSQLQDVAEDGAASGEVVVRAPWLTQGYLDRPEASAELWSGGYLHTQDIGYFEQGYLKITDRLKDVIKTGGEWVSSLEIEDLLSQHVAVADCAVIGVADEKWGERPLALVVTRPGHQSSEVALKGHLAAYSANGQISRFAVPARIVFVDVIAKTSVGKNDKKTLRERFG